MNKKIEEVLPREQSGSDTGKRFDYQYDRAAEECLSLLEDDGAVSVLCEWHDDYVSEYEDEDCDATLYCFFQVKTKDAHLSPWSLNELFGLSTSNKKEKEEKKQEQEEKNKRKCECSIFGRMFNHYQNFNSRCKSVVLVSNAGVDKDIQKLVGSILKAEDEAGMTVDAKEIFNRVFETYHKVFSVSKNNLFLFLKSFIIQSESARLGKSSDDMSTTMMTKILDLSEIELNIKDAKVIGAELVELVRDKSKETINEVELPLSRDELRKRKGIVVNDVLKLLSLSTSAYEELRDCGDKNIVRSISRFHRLCKKNNMSEDLIPYFCQIKANWDLWRREYRIHMDDQDELDFATFTDDCERIMNLHSSGALGFKDMGREAGKLASEYKNLLIGQSELTAKIVTGYIFSLIAERE